MPKDDPLAVFGRKVRRLRGARRMSVEDLAARSGLSVSSVVAIEAGESALPVSVIRALVKGLSVSPDELLRGLPVLSRSTDEARKLFAAPRAASSLDRMRSFRARAASDARGPKPPAMFDEPMPRASADVAVLSVLHRAAMKRPRA